MTVKEILSKKICKPDSEVYELSSKKWDALAKPIDGLGTFEKMVSSIASIQGKVLPDISKKALVIMCADNGVFEEGVSQTNQGVTLDVAELMGEAKSSVGSMLRGYSVETRVYDVGINSDITPKGVIDAKVRRGTANFTKGPAMEEKECLSVIETGIKSVEELKNEGIGIIATGEMGIANTTTSTALLCALEGVDPTSFTGRGAGLSEDAFHKKIEVIERGLRLHRGDNIGQKITAPVEAFEALRRLGGLDIAALSGVFIGGAVYKVPIVIDGLISAVAALVAQRMLPGSRAYMIPSHMGREKGMDIIMNELALNPVISANLALGEGTGAVLLFPMLDMVMNLYGKGIEFDETDIDRYERFEE